MRRSLVLLPMTLVVTACSAAAAPTWTFAPSAASPVVDAITVRTSASASPATVATPAASPPAAATASDPASPASAPVRAAVAIADFAFTPSVIRIVAGGTVTWRNRDSASHSIVIGGAESDRLATGGTYRRTFGAPGTFAYSCGIHDSMRGTVIVMAAGGLPPPAAAEAPPAVDDGTKDGELGDGSTDDDRGDHSGPGHDGADGDDDHGGPGRH